MPSKAIEFLGALFEIYHIRREIEKIAPFFQTFCFNLIVPMKKQNFFYKFPKQMNSFVSMSRRAALMYHLISVKTKVR